MPRAAENVNNGLTISTGVHRRFLSACGVVGCGIEWGEIARGSEFDEVFS
jgi:hypothetical protein